MVATNGNVIQTKDAAIASESVMRERHMDQMHVLPKMSQILEKIKEIKSGGGRRNNDQNCETPMDT
jgi:hypothetical protein